MFKFPLPAPLLGIVMAAASMPLAAADSIADAFREGGWGLSFRYRLESVDQAPFARDATASTLRTRLNFGTANYQGISAFVEFDYVAEVVIDDFDAGQGNTPHRTRYPVVADPKGDDLNQVYLQYQGEGIELRVGRQRIIHDNARFVGNVGWRQNPQTYDAMSLAYATAGETRLSWAFVDNVNRIFGNDVPAGDHDHETHLLNVAREFEGHGKLTGYFYDIDNEDVAGLSCTTWGARYAGTTGTAENRVGYALEFARQDDNGDNATPYDAAYFRIDLSYGLDNGTTIFGGFESLEGDHVRGGRAFRTPLATLHAFNGWADSFLSTPDAGLEDAFLGAKGSVAGWSWNVLYHDFSAQSGPGDFGSEIDASLSRKIADHYGLLLKAARFDSDSPSYGDTTKFWVQFTADFK